MYLIVVQSVYNHFTPPSHAGIVLLLVGYSNKSLIHPRSKIEALVQILVEMLAHSWWQTWLTIRRDVTYKSSSSATDDKSTTDTYGMASPHFLLD